MTDNEQHNPAVAADDLHALCWRPMETAWKDVRPILLLTSDFGAVDGWWDPERSDEFTGEPGAWVSEWKISTEPHLLCGQTPIAWMPSPSRWFCSNCSRRVAFTPDGFPDCTLHPCCPISRIGTGELILPRQSPGLTIGDLQAAAVERSYRYRADIFDVWTLSDWTIATVGELGEAANIVKKLNRARHGLPGNGEIQVEELLAKLGKEIGDTLIYLVQLAHAGGIDIEQVTIKAFNEVSARLDFPERLGGGGDE